MNIQERLLHQQFNTLHDLQATAIEWDDTLFQFKKLQRGAEQRKLPSVPKTQGKPTNGTPMELDYTKLSPEETERRKKARLCFRCGKGGHIG